jgi:hypothetical protein
VDTQYIKAATNICELARRYTTLKKWSSGELAGPCPRCGGTDRFHVHRDGWWKCYRCHATPADAIELIVWAEGCDFPTACAALSAIALRGAALTGSDPAAAHQPARQAVPRGAGPLSRSTGGALEMTGPAWRAANWQRLARHEVEMAVQALAAATPTGDAARAYLAGRGLEPATWQAWSIGCAHQMHPALRTQERCLVIPWQEGGMVKAVQYRYFGERIGKRARFSARPGSVRSLFGLDLMSHRDAFDPRPSPVLRAATLILVEGELNALSIWQAGRALGLDLDVCSIGAEGNVCNPAAVTLAGCYRNVVVWTDEVGRAQQARAAIPHAVTLVSPDGLDANDLLCAEDDGPNGALAEFLPAALAALAEVMVQ